VNPIVILEGPNGVGKSSHAALLAEKLGVSMFRPLREDPNDHWQGNERARLWDMGVPANTFVDDIYAADFLVQMGSGAILDRSMPSAFVYWQAEEHETPEPTMFHLDWWQWKLEKHSGPVLVVFMEANYGVVKDRIGERAPDAKTFGRLGSAFSRVFQRIKLPKMVLDTTRYSLNQGVGRIWTRLLEDANS